MRLVDDPFLPHFRFLPWRSWLSRLASGHDRDRRRRRRREITVHPLARSSINCALGLSGIELFVGLCDEEKRNNYCGKKDVYSSPPLLTRRFTYATQQQRKRRIRDDDDTTTATRVEGSEQREEIEAKSLCGRFGETALKRDGRTD